jgi:hypothetical protein
MPHTIQLRRNTAERWLELNVVLRSGEIGYEMDTNRFKIGNGYTRWDDLDYFLPEAEVRAAIAEAIIASGPGDTSTLLAHINDETPHPAYDEGVDLTVLYENAKV